MRTRMLLQSSGAGRRIVRGVRCRCKRRNSPTTCADDPAHQPAIRLQTPKKSTLPNESGCANAPKFPTLFGSRLPRTPLGKFRAPIRQTSVRKAGVRSSPRIFRRVCMCRCKAACRKSRCEGSGARKRRPASRIHESKHTYHASSELLDRSSTSTISFKRYDGSFPCSDSRWCLLAGCPRLVGSGQVPGVAARRFGTMMKSGCLYVEPRETRSPHSSQRRWLG